LRVLSIKEPYATLIKDGKKCIETRSWKTNYRGELYIQASLSKISKDIIGNRDLIAIVGESQMNYGYIICKCNLADCIYMDNSFIDKIKKNKQEYLCGEYSLGRYAWILEDIIVLDKPILVKGHLGIWNYN
jgi:hypothetical protein